MSRNARGLVATQIFKTHVLVTNEASKIYRRVADGSRTFSVRVREKNISSGADGNFFDTGTGILQLYLLFSLDQWSPKFKCQKFKTILKMSLSGRVRDRPFFGCKEQEIWVLTLTERRCSGQVYNSIYRALLSWHQFWVQLTDILNMRLELASLFFTLNSVPKEQDIGVIFDSGWTSTPRLSLEDLFCSNRRCNQQCDVSKIDLQSTDIVVVATIYRSVDGYPEYDWSAYLHWMRLELAYLFCIELQTGTGKNGIFFGTGTGKNIWSGMGTWKNAWNCSDGYGKNGNFFRYGTGIFLEFCNSTSLH